MKHSPGMKQLDPDSLSYDSVMGCLRSAGKWQEACSFLKTMPQVTSSMLCWLGDVVSDVTPDVLYWKKAARYFFTTLLGKFYAFCIII